MCTYSLLSSTTVFKYSIFVCTVDKEEFVIYRKSTHIPTVAEIRDDIANYLLDYNLEDYNADSIAGIIVKYGNEDFTTYCNLSVQHVWPRNGTLGYIKRMRTRNEVKKRVG
jgi:hypothetical protein